MLGSFIRCQKDECDMTKIQNNAHLCGTPTHNKFLFKAPTVPSTQTPQAFINISFEGEEWVHHQLYGVSVRLRVFEEWTLIVESPSQHP